MLAQIPSRPPELLNIGAAVTLGIAIHPRNMRAALARTISRHSALRTSFPTERGRLLRAVAADIAPPFEAEVSGLTGERFEARAAESFQELMRQPFDLAAAPLWRVRLVRGAGKTENAIALVMHHAIADYRSLTLFFEELARDLAGDGAEAASEVDADEAALADFIRLQALAGSGERLDFWRHKLAQVPPFPRPASPRASAQLVAVPAELVARVREWGKEKRARAAAIYLTAFEQLLRERARVADFLIAVPIDSRVDSRRADAIGFLSIPTLFRSGARPAQAEAAVRAVLAELDGSFANRHTPVTALASILARSGPGASFAPFFFNYVRQRRERMEAPMRRIPTAPEQSEFALSLTVHDDGDEAVAELVCQDESGGVEDVGERFIELVRGLVGAGRGLAVVPPVVTPAAAPVREVLATGIAVAATFVADPIAPIVEAWGTVLRRPFAVELAPYNQVVQQLLDPGSVLYAADTSQIILLVRLADMIQAPRDEDLRELVDSIVQGVQRVVRATGKPVLVGLAPAADDPASALLAAHTARLAGELGAVAGVEVIGADAWQRHYPVAQVFDPEAERLGHVPYSDELYVAMATTLVRTWCRQHSTPVKAIAVDGDNVLWRGVLGEDGVDGVALEPGHLALHRALLALADVGVILCLSSKNDAGIVREFFGRRADSLLRWESFLAHKIDWRPKSENLRELAGELGLGADAILFLDDSLAEVEEVRERCPGVIAVQAPDAAAMAGFLDHLWPLDRGPATADDRERIRRLTDEHKRRALLREVGDHAAFIEKLRVEVEVSPLTAETVARAAQLTVRTNQFNFTTTRRTEAELVALMERADHLAWTVDVEDRFGDYGTTGVVIAGLDGRRLIVSDFLLSCRVLGRGVEHQVLASLGRAARERGALTISLRVRPTERNAPAQLFAAGLGALPTGSNGALELVLDIAAAEAVTPGARAPGNGAGEHVEETIEIPVVTDEASALAASDGGEIAGRIARSLASVGDIARALLRRRRGEEARRMETGTEARIEPPRPEAPHLEASEPALIPDRLRDAWRELLDVDLVRDDADFFALGGDSIRAVRLLAAIHSWSGVRLDLGAFLASPTLSHLASLLGRSLGADAPAEEGGDLHDVLLAAVDREAARLVSPPRGATAPERPRVVLVTGATGFVGSSLLVEIARQSSARIVALVRGRDRADATARLRAACERFGLTWSEVLAARITVEVGDLAAPRLGLAGDVYERLAGEVDWIYHCGARVDFLAAYRDLEATNLGGTAAILAMATHRRLKAVHHVSTLGVFHGPGHAGAAEIAETDAPSEGASLPLGYLHSKWVVERLIVRARERGIPVSVYRPGTVTGGADSPTFNPRDFFVALTAASQDLGALPDMRYVDMVPVDYLARAIWTISSGAAARRPGIFHLAHPAPPTPRDLARWTQWAGIPMTVLPVAAWIAEARKLLARRPDHPLAIFASILDQSDAERNLLHLLAEAPPVRTANTDAALAESGLLCPRIDRALLGRYQDSMRSAGLIGSPFADADEADLLWFTETMAGGCATIDGDQADDEAGEVSEAFLRARVSIQSVQQLLSERRLSLTGTFGCALLDPDPVDIVSGSMRLRPLAGVTLDDGSDQVFITYDLVLRARDGRRYRLCGSKIARPGVRIWSETRTIDIAIAPEERPDRPFLCGRLEIPPSTWFDEQVRGLQVNPRLPARQQLQVKAAWMAFLAMNIGKTYLGVNGSWLVRTFFRG